MNTKSNTRLIQMQVAVRAGLDVRVSKDAEVERAVRAVGLHQYTVITKQGRIFVVLGNLHTKEKLIKAQIDVIAQLNRIMNNVRA